MSTPYIDGSNFYDAFGSFEVFASAISFEAGVNRLNKFVVVAQANAVTDPAVPGRTIVKTRIPAV
ncbi:hypothetical protein M407DRAFT_30284 [Tulasnella calospora MUT 4182]|uniref:Uncharacterized protein n=1 Tax=Tulasnella calospora MUT 4182 TaxID=1051891 RepID=A0A0C3LF29_9AGAM|nr:hypothetical protein M407DRAFT_30284 [Tulasnella calospora MUT 4182]